MHLNVKLLNCVNFFNGDQMHIGRGRGRETKLSVLQDITSKLVNFCAFPIATRSVGRHVCRVLSLSAEESVEEDAQVKTGPTCRFGIIMDTCRTLMSCHCHHVRK